MEFLIYVYTLHTLTHVHACSHTQINKNTWTRDEFKSKAYQKEMQQIKWEGGRERTEHIGLAYRKYSIENLHCGTTAHGLP